jgi:multidrug resistance efflux pump
MKQHRKRTLTFVAIALAGLAGGLVAVHSGRSSEAPPYLTAPVQYGDINATIHRESGGRGQRRNATGTVTALYVDYNSPVRKGQVLARLDPTSFQAAADKANVTLGVQQAQAAADASNIAQARANVSLRTSTLFVIASSLKDMEVDVNVDEANVGQLRAGQTAVISVLAYPNVQFKGIVKQVRVNHQAV